MFDKANFLNSITYGIEQVFKNEVKSWNGNIKVQRNPLNITSISTPNDYYIILLYPRSSKLPYMFEKYGSEKKRRFRVDIFLVSQSDSLTYELAGKVTEFVDTNEHLFGGIGIKKPVIQQEFIKMFSNEMFSTNSINGSISCVVSTIQGEITI